MPLHLDESKIQYHTVSYPVVGGGQELSVLATYKGILGVSCRRQTSLTDEDCRNPLEVNARTRQLEELAKCDLLAELENVYHVLTTEPEDL